MGQGKLMVRMHRALVAVYVCLLVVAPVARGETFSVTSAADSGPGTLRSAVAAANANGNAAVADTIVFKAPALGSTVEVASPLPTLSEPVTVEGCGSRVDPRRPCSGLRGPARAFDGLRVATAGTTLRGLAVTGMQRALVHESDATGLVVANCWFGVGLSGAVEGNRIGAELAGLGGTFGVGAGAGAALGRNVVAGNSDGGVQISGRFYAVRGNLIGKTHGGALAPNGEALVLTGSASDNVIGGDAAAEENVINAPASSAIRVTGVGAIRNVVLSNEGTARDPFIDLGPPLGPGNAPDGANGGIQAPQIAIATTESSSGSAAPFASLRLYRRPGSGALGRLVGVDTADASGAWSIRYRLPPGGRVTATQSLPTTGTSELAAPAAYADVTPPDTKISSGPSGLVDGPDAAFGFSATEAGASFTCSTDSGPWRPCSSPSTLRRLQGGWHAFQVRATDAAGNTDRSPALRRFGIRADRVPPRVLGLSLRPRVVHAGRSLVLRLRLSEAGIVTIGVERWARGVRRGRHCVATRRAFAVRKRCTRWLRVARVRLPAAAGRSRHVLTRRRVRALRPGSYRIAVVVVDAASNRSRVRRTPFAVRR
jgi:hypothetical protein